MALPVKQSISIPKVLSTTDTTGFAVVEIIIAMALFLVAITGILTLLWTGQTAATELSRRYEALTLAQTAMDKTIAQSWTSFKDIKNSVTNDSIYQTTITITLLNLYTRQITVTISWQAKPSYRQNVNLTSLVTDKQSALAGSTCLAAPDAQSPATIMGSINFGSGNNATGVIVRNNFAFVTTDSTVASAEDFFVVDVTNPASPIVVGKLNTGPGLSGLTMSNGYAYVGNTSINGQLQIIDISNVQAPALKATYKLPGTYTDNTTITNAITSNGHTVYLGTQKSQISEFHIIDISDAAAPRELGSYEINAGVNAIAVINTLAYIASPAAEEIKVVDTSNPAQVRQINIFDAPGGSGNGKSLTVLNNNLFLGRTIGGKELYNLDITDALRINELNSKDLNASIVTLTAVPGWLYLASTDSSKTLQIWNVTATNSLTLAKSLPVAGVPTALACGIDKLYLTTQNGLTVITP
jgi:Tfp pilus assembly protein PilV